MNGQILSKKSLANTILTLLLISANCLFAAESSDKETIRVGTWNVEHFMMMFDQDRMPERSRNMTEFYADDEEQYEVAAVLKADSFNPDIVVIEECCDQEMLEYFCKKWFPNRFAYIKVFDSNVEGQYLGVLAKPGFEAVRVEQFLNDQDPVTDNSLKYTKSNAGLWEKNLLFSRGPGFVMFKTPGGNKLWIGVTHTKSKSGNSKAVTEWRIRELERTRQICGELIAASDTKNLLMMGDFNDDFNMDNFETSLGQDAIEVMLKGEGSEKLISLDESYRKAHPDAATYHCAIKPPKYRSFLDHIFASPSAAELEVKTVMIDESIAFAASDHLPLLTVLEFPGRSK